MVLKDSLLVQPTGRRWRRNRLWWWLCSSTVGIAVVLLSAGLAVRTLDQWRLFDHVEKLTHAVQDQSHSAVVRCDDLYAGLRSVQEHTEHRSGLPTYGILEQDAELLPTLQEQYFRAVEQHIVEPLMAQRRQALAQWLTQAPALGADSDALMSWLFLRAGAVVDGAVTPIAATDMSLWMQRPGWLAAVFPEGDEAERALVHLQRLQAERSLRAVVSENLLTSVQSQLRARPWGQLLAAATLADELLQMPIPAGIVASQPAPSQSCARAGYALGSSAAQQLVDLEPLLQALYAPSASGSVVQARDWQLPQARATLIERQWRDWLATLRVQDSSQPDVLAQLEAFYGACATMAARSRSARTATVLKSGADPTRATTCSPQRCEHSLAA